MIDVISPLTASFERTKQILFRPFILEKWLVLAFASFLIQPFTGGRWGESPDYTRTTSGTVDHPEVQEPFQEQIQAFLHNQFIILIFIVVTGVILVMALGLSWLSARGQFMLLDNIVRNRVSISEPWRVFGAQANRLWLFNLVWGFVFMAFIMVLTFPAIVFISLNSTAWSAMTVPLILYGLIAMSVCIPAIIAANIIILFIPPIMYRNGVSPWIALKMAVALIWKDPLSILLMVLLLIGLGLGFGSLLSILMICPFCIFTCILGCIIGIPFVGSVLLLPLTVFFRCYIWDVLAQYGPEYNVWAGPTPTDLQRPN